jgi:hypothetical protein
MESYWAQITRCMLPEQERSRLENYGYSTKNRYWETFYLHRTIKTLESTTCRGASTLSLADNTISERGLGNCLFVKGL